MINDAHPYAVHELFNAEKDWEYFVPIYQRGYSWKKSHWNDLFDDLTENEIGHFLGSIICVNSKKNSFDPDRLEVIDGQQRLMTLSLLLAAIHMEISALGLELTDEQKMSLWSVKRMLTVDGTPRFTPQKEAENRTDYFAALYAAGVTVTEKTGDGRRQVLRAFNHLRKRLKELHGASPEETASELFEYLKKVKSAIAVKIEVASHADAYRLFESLNNRGEPLTAIDIIKNKLLERVDREKIGDVDKYYIDWSAAIKSVGDDPKIHERFLSQYYNAFRDDLGIAEDYKFAKQTNLIDVYEALIDHDAAGFIDPLGRAAKTYSLFLDGADYSELGPGFTSALVDLRHVPSAPTLVLALFLIQRRDIMQLDEALLERIVNLVVRFVVRRSLTNEPATRELIPLFLRIIARLRADEATGEDVFAIVREELLSVSATDDRLREELAGPVYEESAALTKFLLAYAEAPHQGGENPTDFWQELKGKDNWSVEHVLPQGDNPPDHWVTMVAGAGNTELAKEIIQTHGHTLGNLTLTRFNKELGTKPFDYKRDMTEDGTNVKIGYNNGLHINETIATLDTWTVDRIRERTELLVAELVVLLKM